MVYFVFGILIALVVISLLRGYRPAELVKLALPGVKTSFIVVGVLILIGCLTGLWRSCGTIAYFIVFGVGLCPPGLFVLLAFLLSALMSLAIGTSFGVVATAGVILMSIARAGGMKLIVVAGAIMSGIYVGDRNSPAASSATLVATLTGTDLNRNVKLMFRSSAVPLGICMVIYTLLSFAFPLQSIRSEAVSLLEDSFTMSGLCLLPAVLMLVLPLCRVKVKTAMAVDIAVSFALSVLLQGNSPLKALECMVLGYRAESAEAAALLNGGGIKSMLTVCTILLVSGCFGGLLRGTGLLDRVYGVIDRLNGKIGRFPTVVLLSLTSCMVFCNQTVGAVLVDKLSEGLFSGEEKYDKMLAMEDSVIPLAGLVPWCIASSVPLATMGVGAGALLFSFFLWLVPLWHGLRYRHISFTKIEASYEKI